MVMIYSEGFDHCYTISDVTKPLTNADDYFVVGDCVVLNEPYAKRMAFKNLEPGKVYKIRGFATTGSNKTKTWTCALLEGFTDGQAFWGGWLCLATASGRIVETPQFDKTG